MRIQNGLKPSNINTTMLAANVSSQSLDISIVSQVFHISN